MDVSKAAASIRGAIYSLTIWAAALAEVFGEVVPLVTPDFLTSLGLHPHTVTVVCRAMAIVMVVCRGLTSKSLADKVAPVAASVPPTSNQKGFIDMRLSIYLGAALLVVTLGACSLIQKLESPAAQPFDAIAVAVGVDTLVGTNPSVQAARAASIKAIAQEVLAVDTGTQATLTTLESVAAAKVQALKLPPGDAAASQLLIAALSATVNTYVGKLGSNAKANEVQVDVAAVLGWVIAECDKFLPKTASAGPSWSFRYVHSMEPNFVRARVYRA
jgi:hypothetical protein